MEIKSYSKYMRISPKKAREVARILPGKKATEGLSLLKYIPRKAARLLDKTLKSAMANAENNSNLNADDLLIKEAVINEGPALKRFRPCLLSDVRMNTVEYGSQVLQEITRWA